jgi:hypothetical protein
MHTKAGEARLPRTAFAAMAAALAGALRFNLNL